MAKMFEKLKMWWTQGRPIHPRHRVVDAMVDDRRKIMYGRTVVEGETVSEIAKHLEFWANDTEFLAALLVRLQSENATFPGSLWITREFILPQLQARAALDQLSAAKRFGWAAIALGTLAVIFGAIQAYYAYVSAHLVR